MKIYLRTFKDVNDFAKITENLDCEVVVESEDRKYRVDGKSILGLYSLDLSMPLILYQIWLRRQHNRLPYRNTSSSFHYKTS